MTRSAIVILFLLRAAAQADAQGFASGQEMRFDGSSRFPPTDVERDSPERTREKAFEPRDHHAAARRLAEKDRDAKKSELADLDAAANGVEQDAARVEAGALDSARKLGSRIGQSQSRNPMTKAKAGLGRLSDLAKTKVAFDDFGDDFLVRLGPERARLRREISKLTKNIDLYLRQEAYWQAKADEAESEIEATAAFEAGLHRSRVQSGAVGVKTSALVKAWAQDQAAAARAKDNVQSQSQTPGLVSGRSGGSSGGSSSGNTREGGDPSRTGGERAAAKSEGGNSGKPDRSTPGRSTPDRSIPDRGGKKGGGGDNGQKGGPAIPRG